jgi:hypothetical protein
MGSETVQGAPPLQAKRLTALKAGNIVSALSDTHPSWKGDTSMKVKTKVRAGSDPPILVGGGG